MEDIFERLYDMTAFSNIIAEPQFLIMYAIAFILLYLGIKKKYEPLLLIPIAFGVLLANFPGGEMGVVQADENGMVMVNGALKNIWEMPLHEIAHDLGLMNFIYYMLIKTGFLPPIIFMGVGALTDFGPMLRNLRLSIFGAAAQLGIFTVLLVAILMGFTPKEAASLGIIGGADGPTAIFTTIKLATFARADCYCRLFVYGSYIRYHSVGCENLVYEERIEYQYEGTGKEISFFGRNQESSCAEDCISDCSDYGGRSVCAKCSAFDWYVDVW